MNSASVVRQIAIQTAEPLVPVPSHFNVEVAVAKLRKYNLPSSDKIMEELIQAGGKTLLSEIHELLSFYMEYG
jgi:hypothetical protein